MKHKITVEFMKWPQDLSKSTFTRDLINYDRSSEGNEFIFTLMSQAAEFLTVSGYSKCIRKNISTPHFTECKLYKIHCCNKRSC